MKFNDIKTLTMFHMLSFLKIHFLRTLTFLLPSPIPFHQLGIKIQAIPRNK